VEGQIVTSRTEYLHVEVDEKHTAEEASKTRQYAEYKLIAAISVDINEPTIGNTVTAVHKSNHKQFERIDVQVCLGEL
jgi:NADPH-dependent curcumin reductase CurA